MILCIEALGMSRELAEHATRGLAQHNAAWWRREIAAGRGAIDWTARLRYQRPEISDRPRLRDAPILLALGYGGCAELAAAYLGWVWANGVLAELDTTRVNLETWHFRVARPGNPSGRVLWDPERVFDHVA